MTNLCDAMGCEPLTNICISVNEHGSGLKLLRLVCKHLNLIMCQAVSKYHLVLDGEGSFDHLHTEKPSRRLGDFLKHTQLAGLHIQVCSGEQSGTCITLRSSSLMSQPYEKMSFVQNLLNMHIKHICKQQESIGLQLFLIKDDTTSKACCNASLPCLCWWSCCQFHIPAR